MKAVDLTGQRFHRLVVLRRTESPPFYTYTGTWWLCKCDCGAEITVRSYALRKGSTKSCGCYCRDRMVAMNKSGKKKKEESQACTH